jgi:hypothetical protein
VRRAALPLLALLVAAAPGADWRRIATDADRSRLRAWRDSWVAALARARPAAGSALAAEGALFDPDAALGGALPPPGDYRCRTFKLGAKTPGLLEFVAYPAFRCRVGADGALAKLDGSQRPVGQLYPETDARAAFLGTLALGDERSAMAYGRDRNRDVAGFVERVGRDRWRLVMPAPRFESLLDVMELVPALPQ